MKIPRWLWPVAGIFGTLSTGVFLATVVLVVILIPVIFLAGFGYWIAGLFGSSPPAFATKTSRPTEWLIPATVDAEFAQGIPNAVVMAVIQQASDGQVFGDRYYCSNHQTSGEPCSVAYPGHPASTTSRGLKVAAVPPAKTLGIGKGLMGLNPQDLTLPQGKTWHSVSWNLKTGIDRLAAVLRSSPYWMYGLPTFHSRTQTPPGWTGTGSYAQTIKSLVQRYESGPTLGAWALAGWSTKTGQFQDPANKPEWVFVVGAAPTGAPFSRSWRPPTAYCQPQAGGHACKTIQIPHVLSGRDLSAPVRVVGIEKSGAQVIFHLSSQKQSIPVWQGGTVWGAQVPLTGPHALKHIVATWANGTVDTIAWPEQASGAVSAVTHVPPTQAVKQWWADIQIAAQKTGVPADWIAAEMLNESGGLANAGSQGLAGAYGLMQLEPATAHGLPGYTPGARQNPQTNLVLGAELLAQMHQQFGSWRIASAAYYGGAGSVQNAGVTAGMTWTQAAPHLTVVPFISAGNSLTMTEYANNIEATAKAVKAMPHK